MIFRRGKIGAEGGTRCAHCTNTPAVQENSRLHEDVAVHKPVAQVEDHLTATAVARSGNDGTTTVGPELAATKSATKQRDGGGVRLAPAVTTISAESDGMGSDKLVKGNTISRRHRMDGSIEVLLRLHARHTFNVDLFRPEKNVDQASPPTGGLKEPTTEDYVDALPCPWRRRLRRRSPRRRKRPSSRYRWPP